MIHETTISSSEIAAANNPNYYIFVLPSGTTDFNVKLTYQFKYKDKTYLYTLSTTGREDFKAGKQVKLNATVQCKNAPKTLKLKKIEIS